VSLKAIRLLDAAADLISHSVPGSERLGELLEDVRRQIERSQALDNRLGVVRDSTN
jgi:hypothetical protein